MDNILERIISLCSEKNIEQKEITNFLGINNSAFSEWKSGKSKSYKKYISDIADYLEVSTDYLLGKTDQKEKPSGGNAEKLSDMHREIMERLSTLSPEKLREAESYIDFLLAQQEKDNQ